MIQRCPSCQQQFASSESTSGATSKCPHCGQDVPAAATSDLLPQSARPLTADWIAAAPLQQGEDPDATPTFHGPPGGGRRSGHAGAAPVPEIPDYEILGELGRGGMGIVYEARHRALQRRVALKVLGTGTAASLEGLARFRTEAEAVARLQHPHVVQIYDVGSHAGLAYFALQLCAGGSLATKLDGTPMPGRAAAALLHKLAGGMQAAHDAQIIHRDLKPANILLTAEGEPKISDFGLAKKLDAVGHTHSGAILGTPKYMAPEQVQGATQRLGPWTDQYALGVILYELLTGRVPFQAATPEETLAQILLQDPVRPTQLQPGSSRDLETICLKCLEKEPERRFPSCRALQDELGRYLRGEPIKTRRAGVVERVGKWARRHPARAGLVTISVLATVLLAGGAVVYYEQQIGILNRQLSHEVNLRAVREQAGTDQRLGERFEAEKRFEDARAAYASALAALKAQPELHDEPLRTEVERRLDHIGHVLAARQDVARFRAPYDRALSHLMQLTGLDAAANKVQVRAAARDGLALFGLADDAAPVDGRLSTLQPYLTAPEHAALVTACYELLLLLAGVEAEGPAADRTAAASTVERAGRLGEKYGLKSLAYDARRVQIEALREGKPLPAPGIRAAGRQPSQGLDWFLLALESYTAGGTARIEEARQACTEVLRQQPEHFWARYLQSLCSLRTGDWPAAKDGLTDCLSRRPAFAWPLVLRGFAARELGVKHQDAAEFERARADFDRALLQDSDPLLQYTVLVNRGVLFIRQRQWAHAIADLGRALPLRPEAYQAYVNLADAHAGAGQWAEAVASLNQAVQKAPALGYLYSDRAALHLTLKNLTAARADFEKVIALGPQLDAPLRVASAHVELAKMLVDANRDLPAALSHYEAAVGLQPTYDVAHRLRAEVLLKLAEIEPRAQAALRRQEAARALDRYLELAARPDIKAYRSRGLLYLEAGKLARAVEVLSLGLQRAPQERKCLVYRGWAYLLMNAGEAALEDFDACLQRAPDDLEALCLRGRARALQKQVEGALADAEAVRSRIPRCEIEEQPRLRYNLACLYSQLLGLPADSGRSDTDQTQYSALYRKRLGQQLREVLESLAPERREAFWREQIQLDPALSALRRDPLLAELAGQYHRQAAMVPD